MKEKKSYNIATNVIGEYYVSTAMWPTLIAYAGGYVETWETFIWEWDKKKRERKHNLIKQYYHKGERRAIKFHLRFCRTLIYRNIRSIEKEEGQ